MPEAGKKIDWNRVTVLFFSAIAVSHIISAAYLGIIGEHAFRQADVYAHILGFMGFKDFICFDRFVAGLRQVFDIPLYQMGIALISGILRSDPLVVTRYVNAVLWGLSAFWGYRLVSVPGRPGAGAVFVGLFASAPLMFHYYSAPLPDLLAIAFSLLGMYLLEHRANLDRETLRQYVSASIPLALATLIKPPVPFVFIVFWVANRTIGYLLSRNSARPRFKAMVLPGLLLAALLAVAIGSELLRTALPGSGSSGLGWYFGTMALRESPEFWHELITRIDLFGFPHFFEIYAAVAVASSVVCFSAGHLAYTLSALIAFFSGWMVFSGVYMPHNYYQLPVAVILQLSLAISVSLLWEAAVKRVPDSWKHRATAMAALVLITAVGFQAAFGKKLESRSRASVYPAIEYALRDVDRLLYVTEAHQAWPVVGGLAATKTVGISPEQFEADCVRLMDEYPAILVEGYSRCLEAARTKSDYYIADGNIVFYYRRGDGIRMLKRLNSSMLMASSVFDIYMDDRTLYYYREGCEGTDVTPRLFVHVYPKDVSDLPFGTLYGVENLDFNFMENGRFVGSGCIAGISLPSYPIDSIETGQFKSGRTLWSCRFSPLTPEQGKQKASVNRLIPELTDQNRVAESFFDIYRIGRKLVYRKQDCSPGDTLNRFFVHVVPRKVSDLDPDSRKNGFANLDFDFRRVGFRFEGQGIAVIDLPDFDISVIRTGQYTGKGYVWSTVIVPDEQ